ncbi:MAG TPA: Rrf2 family transcriptional regulator [Terriglobia bacterium]|jgi:Rrf2 family protein|nr:Rrf2 family transcriptional regulator [Terriglobia bacterium]
MLSKKAKYGLKAMAILAKEYGNGPLLIGEIAKRERIPSKFLELILLELKKKGFLQSKKGKGGGYYLSKLPESISVGALIRALDGPLALLPCVSQMAYERCAECPDEQTCGIRIVFKEVRESTVSILERTTLAQMAMVNGHPS